VFPEGRQILIVDEPGEARHVQSILKTIGQEVSITSSAAAALDLAAREDFDMALVGLGLAGDGPGGLLSRLRSTARIPSILILARHERARDAIRALARGADDYLLKPLDRHEVRSRIGRILRWQDLDDRVLRMQKEMSRKYLLGNLVCRSPGMRKVRAQIMQVASARSTILIRGPSGVGKELVAKAIHYNSARRDAPFIAINCSAIPVTLIESELFGHERGSFTGAYERQKGKFELADGGTIFLDEIGEMNLETQAKLLRVLEEREFMRVGGGREVRVDVRVLAATNSDLESMIARRRFREDLYFRLKVVPIHLPPLRDRFEDLPVLVAHFMAEFSGAFHKGFVGVSKGAMDAIRAYEWPGNIRELRNCMERAVLLHEGEELTAEMMQIAGGSMPLDEGVAEFLDVIRSVSESGFPEQGLPFERLVNSVERFLITKASEKAGWNQTQAARYLHLNRDKLRTRMKNYDLGRHP